jgi:predicted PilT family ATPase
MLYKVYVYCKQVVKMPVKASAEKRELILKIYKYFGAERKRKAPFYA